MLKVVAIAAVAGFVVACAFYGLSGDEMPLWACAAIGMGVFAGMLANHRQASIEAHAGGFMDTDGQF